MSPISTALYSRRLPDKPSDLITLALADLALAEASPEYKIAMGDWHLPGRRVCYVCLAGAVMAGTLGAPSDVDLTPFSFNANTRNKLQALDCFRQGTITVAFYHLGIDATDVPLRRWIPPYSNGPVQWRQHMERLAQELKTGGW